MAELEEVDDYDMMDDDATFDGKPGWTNSDGDRLEDYGVDEDEDDDEDVPLAELIRRRKVLRKGSDE